MLQNKQLVELKQYDLCYVAKIDVIIRPPKLELTKKTKNRSHEQNLSLKEKHVTKHLSL